MAVIKDVIAVGHVLRLFSAACTIFKRAGVILRRVKVTKQRHLYKILDEIRAGYARQEFGGYKFGMVFQIAEFANISSLPIFLSHQYFPLYGSVSTSPRWLSMLVSFLLELLLW